MEVVLLNGLTSTLCMHWETKLCALQYLSAAAGDVLREMCYNIITFFNDRLGFFSSIFENHGVKGNITNKVHIVVKSMVTMAK